MKINMKNILSAVAVILSMTLQLVFTVAATDGVQPLQAYFTDDGKVMKIFTSESLDPKASVLIGNKTLAAEKITSDVEIRTVFLVDNSTSIPSSLREEVKTAISDYVAVMPESESVKVAMFDTKTHVLAEDYSDDSEFINYELSKIDFQGQASLIYDAILNVSEDIDTSMDVYYRTVLITDGVDTIEGTSFDYLRSVISENGRYHVDVVQVSEETKKDVNLSAISNLGSNSFTLFNSGISFDSLRPENVSMLKVKLTNDITTGELKGVTIKNGNSNISLGSIMFPQVEIETPIPTEKITMTEKTTKVIETTKETTIETKITESQKNDNDSRGFFIILIVTVIGGILIAVGVITAVILLKKKKNLQCCVSVQISKDDERDKNGTGMDVWQFSVDSEFRVGRLIEPKSNDNTVLLKNHRAICENATNEDISSIGRNAFALTYDKKTNSVIIKNIAKSAMFYVETGGRRNEVRSGNSISIMKGSKILLGNYTTVIIYNITINNG